MKDVSTFFPCMLLPVSEVSEDHLVSLSQCEMLVLLAWINKHHIFKRLEGMCFFFLSDASLFHHFFYLLFLPRAWGMRLQYAGYWIVYSCYEQPPRHCIGFFWQRWVAHWVSSKLLAFVTVFLFVCCICVSSIRYLFLYQKDVKCSTVSFLLEKPGVPKASHSTS